MPADDRLAGIQAQLPPAARHDARTRPLAIALITRPGHALDGACAPSALPVHASVAAAGPEHGPQLQRARERPETLRAPVRSRRCTSASDTGSAQTEAGAVMQRLLRARVQQGLRHCVRHRHRAACV